MWPSTARWCAAVAACQISLCILVALLDFVGTTIGPTYRAVNEDEMELFESAKKVLIVPFCFVLVSGVMAMWSSAREQVLVTCVVVTLEFGIQITYYTLLAGSRGLGFTNQRCYDDRPIYATRWMGWSFAIPMLIFMNLYPLVDHQGIVQVLSRLCPQMIASAAYCWTCFLGCVVIDAWLGWTLIALGCISYILVIFDEVCFVSEHLLTTTKHLLMPAIKGYSIIIKECLFVFYTGVFLMGNSSFASSYACQRFYTVADISLKATMAFLLFIFLMCGTNSPGRRKDA